MLHEKTTYYVIHKETLREAKEDIMKDTILSLTIKILYPFNTTSAHIFEDRYIGS